MTVCQKQATTKMAAPLELQQEEKLIDLWPEYPCLYDVRSPEFRNKILRDQAIEELAKKVNQTAECITKKMRNLRNNYTKSLKPPKSGSARKQSSRNSWLQDKLQFLSPFVASRPTVSNIEASSPTPSTSIQLDKDITDDKDETDSADESTELKIITPVKSPLKKKQKLSKKRMEEEELKLLHQIVDSACANQKVDSPPDKIDLFGQYVSASLREFDEFTRNVAQHKISGIVFEAQLGLLNRQQQPAAHTFYSQNMSENNFSTISTDVSKFY